MRIVPTHLPRPDKLPSRVQRRAAFTLVEVLLVVALLGMVAFAFVNSAADLFRSREPRADDAFWGAVTAARQLALEGNQTVLLRYNEEKHFIEWGAGTEPVKTLPFPGKMLEFLPVVTQGTILLGGQLRETDSIKVVRFYPDGCCDAFRIQLTDPNGRISILGIDPWTCAPMLVTPPK